MISDYGVRCPADYSADVYGFVTEMFAANVFRPLPPSSYADTDEEVAAGRGGIGTAVVVGEPTADEVLEATQTVLVYQVFRAFVDRVMFDADRAQPYLNRRFVNGLVHRLNSGDADERLTVRDIAERVWTTCPAARSTMFRAAADELADFAYGYVPRHNGVNELLDFFAVTAGTAGHAAVPKVTYNAARHRSPSPATVFGRTDLDRCGALPTNSVHG
uniref:Serine/threonine-protein phosphatase 2A regulatory subunit psrA n=1 Tax=Sipha flava TaxID=143950 RepID=A0A2S2Q0Z5_9HEMI